MRRIKRPTLRPPTLETGKGFEQATKQANGTARRDDFPDYWTAADVRGALRAMCGSACAYCEDIVGRPGEDVEHYRPKNLYWFIAYSFDNFLPSCRRCNSARKGNRFPVVDGAPRAIQSSEIGRERRRLLDPVHDDIEAAMRIDLSDGRYEWEPNPAGSALLRDRADFTIDFFQLNDDGQLLARRARKIARFVRNARSSDPDVRAEALREASRFVEFGGAIRSVLAQKNPALIPSIVEEIQWAVEWLVEVNEAFKKSQRPNKKNMETAQYALAATWARPPRGVRRSDIEAWIRARDDALPGELADKATAVRAGRAP